MRYAIFTDIHANLEALEAVLAKIDEIAQKKPIDDIWFLGDLVGYGPNPNECIVIMRERTHVIIAGNHDWAAVGKIDLEDFSAAARVSAEWTAKELTKEHHTFLSDLPERLEIGDCTLVHGSPYGPLWEYLTSEALAERSFKYFNSRYCFVGHTHVPVIFQQPISSQYDEEFANAPTIPLSSPDTSQSNGIEKGSGIAGDADEDDDETVEVAAIQHAKTAAQAESAYADPKTNQSVSEEEANTMIEPTMRSSISNAKEEEVHSPAATTMSSPDQDIDEDEANPLESTMASPDSNAGKDETPTTIEPMLSSPDLPAAAVEEIDTDVKDLISNPQATLNIPTGEEGDVAVEEEEVADEVRPEAIKLSAEELTNREIEELLTLLGLSQSMIQVTNEMQTPPEGEWQAPEGNRFIINPGGVGQPRDGDPRAAFMIYDTERGFEFYRVPYDIEKTQEKIIEAGLPQYLAIRLAYGR